MGIHGTKMELVWKDHTLERSHVHMQGMCIRAANCHNTLSICQQIVPALKGFEYGAMPNELWKEGIEHTMKFCVKHGLKFTQSIPQFDAGEALHLPGFPGDICLMEGRRFRVAWVSDKR